MRICYLHIGAPKSGSTSIQKSFFSERAMLAENGFFYPGGKKSRQNFLATLYHQNPMTLRFNRESGVDEEIIVSRALRDQNQFQKNAQENPNHTILLSNEILLGNAPYLNLSALGDFLFSIADKVVVVAIVRDPLALMVSRAQEQIKSGARTYSEVAQSPDMHDLRYLDIFTDAFGAENLKVVALESLVKNGASLVTQFATMIGVSDALANALPEKRINASLTLEGAFLASELNKFAGQSVGRRKRPDGTIAETRGLPARAFRNIGQTKFTLPSETIVRSRAALNEQYAYLAERFGIDYPIPPMDAVEPVEPDWGTPTLSSLVAMLNDLGVTNQRLRKKRRNRRRKRSEASNT